jgi:ribose transport system permease protein
MQTSEKSQATLPPPEQSVKQELKKKNPSLVLGLRAVRTGPVLILVLLCIVLFTATPDFLTAGNIANIGIQTSVVAILALGQFMVILTQGIDLSVGSVLSLASVVGAMLYVHGQVGEFAIVGMLLVGMLVGFINGFVLTRWRIPHPFIVTLGTLNVAAGIALLLSNGSAVLGSPAIATFLGTARILGIPVPVIFTIVLATLAWLFTNRIQAGRWLYALGGNPEGAKRAGIPVKNLLTMAYVLSGLLAACAAIVLVGRTSSGYPIAGLGLELDAIAAVIIGGTSFFGGRGTVGNVIVGALILGVLRNGLNLLNVSSFWQQVAIGVILVVAVGIDVLRSDIEKKIRTAEAKALAS